MDPNYTFYIYIDSLKNMVHRHLTSAATSGVFWPKFYYSWFYTDERTLYNILSLKQQLGSSIDKKDIESYNLMREQMIPVSPYKLAIKKRSDYYEDQKVVFDDIVCKRKSFWKLFILSAFTGFLGKKYFLMSNLWLYTCYIPLALLYVHDKKNVPLDEIENFYKYALEVKKTKAFYESSRQAVARALYNENKHYVRSIQDDLTKSNKTLFEVVSGIDAELLKLAERNITV